MTRKSSEQLSFFDYEKRLEKINQKDKLQFIEAIIPWGMFGSLLREAFGLRGEGGRPGYDELKIFKVLILQRLYGVSDDEMEFALNDRLSFQRFAGFGSHETIPDAKTIWLYRERLTKSQKSEELFNLFEGHLNKLGFRAKEGVDATVVELPGNGITKESYEEIKKEEDKEEIEPNKARRSQIDFEARYTSKDKGRSFIYGYKSHVKVCSKHKFIRAQIVTEASRGESTVAKELMRGLTKGTKFYADSAYDTLELHSEIKRRGLRDNISKQTKRNKTHNVGQNINHYNAKQAKVRKRVEHVFAHLKHTMKGGFIRCVGKLRATAIITLNNLAYNLDRYRYLVA